MKNTLFTAATVIPKPGLKGITLTYSDKYDAIMFDNTYSITYVLDTTKRKI